MNINLDHGVCESAKVFKFILDELVSKTPVWKKIKLYEQHCKKVEKRNAAKQKMIKVKGKSKKEYSEKPMKQNIFIRFYILLKLLKTDYAAFIDDCTLNEVGYIIGITRERVRQIEYQAIMKIKSPKLLQMLNNRNSIETVMEYKEIAIQRKNNIRRKQQ